jgi:hypothetical protein
MEAKMKARDSAATAARGEEDSGVKLMIPFLLDSDSQCVRKIPYRNRTVLKWPTALLRFGWTGDIPSSGTQTRWFRECAGTVEADPVVCDVPERPSAAKSGF